MSSSDKPANPAPLGLMAFGLTTVMLNIHNAGFFPLGSMVLALGLFYGGMAQVITGIMEFKNGNTFGTVAFTSYGCFWISLVALLLLPKLGLADADPHAYMAAFFFTWGLFTLLMFFGTLKGSKGLQFVFLSLAVLFFLLCIRDLTGSAAIATFAGWEGIVCGASAIYVAMAQVLHEQWGKVILPY